MPPLTRPTGFTAGRALTLKGTVYAKGAAVPSAVLRGVRNLSGLLARGWLVASPPMRPVRGWTGRPRPAEMPVDVRRGL